MTGATEEIQYHHNFNDEELDMMLFQWDEAAAPVVEYHYMKQEWKTPEMAIVNGQKPTKTFPPKKVNPRGQTRDTGYRTVVDLNKEAPFDEEPIPLDLNTWNAVHVVEFYQPWCGHCRNSKPRLVDVAREVSRRSIAIPIKFHAVSCQLYREICRAYDISGFPFIYGWKIGTNIAEKGIELNPPGRKITAESFAHYLGLTLASERKDFKSTNSTTPENAEAMAIKSALEKRERLEYKSVLNDRYHNAAVSLAFVLKTGVFVKHTDYIEDSRALALNEFLQLVYWATPQSWSIRTGMVDEILSKMGDIIDNGGGRMLSAIVDRHQTSSLHKGDLWGDVELKHTMGNTLGLGVDVPHLDKVVDNSFRENNRWTQACTQNERGMGFTCGLWDLIHIITIGTSIKTHRVFAFRSGYIVEPKQIAEVMKRFITHFFACDVCRWNFKDMYERCGHNHCKRLIDTMPELSGASPKLQIEQGRELAMWFWEVHNAVSVRLMREAATRENRKATEQEKLSAVFPTLTQCPNCWLKDDMSQYDPDIVFDFLQGWYWPQVEQRNSRFTATIQRKLRYATVMASAKEHWDSWWFIIGPVALVMAFYLRKCLERKANSRRKDV